MTAPRLLPRWFSRVMARYHAAPDHPMKMRLWYGLWRLSGFARFVLPYAGRGWISLDPRDYVQGVLFNTGSWEPEVWEALSQEARDGDVLWDIGAHIGAFTLRAGLDDRFASVQSFEPNPDQRAVLERHLAMNSGRYALHGFALSDRAEVRRLTAGPAANSGQASLAGDGRGMGFDVACETIDRLIFDQGLPPPTLVKMDVEGWEAAVLRGARRLFAERPPRAIVFEGPHGPDGAPTGEAVALLQEAGYRLRRIPRAAGAMEHFENYLAVLTPRS